MLNFISRLQLISYFFITVALLLSGCSSSKSSVGGVLNLDTDLKINFVVDGSVNPDDKKRPSPVIVRLYELKASSIFNKADFLDLYERDTEILGGDFVHKIILKPLTPGVGRTDTLILRNGASHVALYAEFSQYRGSIYKLAFPVTENNVMKNEVTINISGTEISIAKNEKPKKKK